MSEEGGKNGAEELHELRVDPLVLGPDDIYYTAQDMHDCEQEWQEVHKKDLLNIQQ